MGGYPVVYPTDWCGDHRLDENKSASVMLEVEKVSDKLRKQDVPKVCPRCLYPIRSTSLSPHEETCICDRPKRSLPEDEDCERCGQQIEMPYDKRPQY